MTEWHIFEGFPDSPEGARRLLAEDSDLEGIAEARLTPDPSIPGCWLVEARGWRAIVYVGNHRLSGDWEVVD